MDELVVRQCNMTKEDLDAHLKESDYGERHAVFRCYFVEGTIPPRCATCRKGIGEHTSARGGLCVVEALPYDATGDEELLQPPDGLKPAMTFRGDECTAETLPGINDWGFCVIGPFALCLCCYTERMEFRHDTREVVMRRYYMCKETAHSMPYDNLPTDGPTLSPSGNERTHSVVLKATVTGSDCCCDPDCGSWTLTRAFPGSKPHLERYKWTQYFRRIKKMV
jgi:hypothetical protein